MATDYQARKRAKSQRSKQQSSERRRKKGPSRKLRGHCFSPNPSLEIDEESQQTGKPKESKIHQTSDENQHSRKRRQRSSLEVNTAAVDTDDTQRKQIITKKARKFSTSVNLLSPTILKQPVNKSSSTPVKDDNEWPAPIIRFLKGERLTGPLPIQSKCWPHFLAGEDVQVVAQPGSGKTLAYLLPAACHLASTSQRGLTGLHPSVLVLLPTRELAQQVAQVGKKIQKHCGIRTACVTGGVDKVQQLDELRTRKPDILVATPGRLLDVLQSDDVLFLDNVSIVILDEADKMLSLGFLPQIEQIREYITKTRPFPWKLPQIGLFTATMQGDVIEIAREWLNTPQFITLDESREPNTSTHKDSGASTAISTTVVQIAQVCAEHKKPGKLLKHLEGIKEANKGQRHAPRVLIFANRIKSVRFIHKKLLGAGYRASQLHGERSQDERDTALRDFRGGKTQILVASDVAARGLDIHNLPYVVNYDFPANLETYIHRVGRTGRLHANGHAYSFLTRELAPVAQPLIELLEKHGQSIDPNLVKLAEAYAVATEKLGKERATGKKKVAGEKKKGLVEKNVEEDSGSDVEQKQFIASKKFVGAKKGYAFKKGGLGIGYYIDSPPYIVWKQRIEELKKMNKKSLGPKPLLPGKMKQLKRRAELD